MTSLPDELTKAMALLEPIITDITERTLDAYMAGMERMLKAGLPTKVAHECTINAINGALKVANENLPKTMAVLSK